MARVLRRSVGGIVLALVVVLPLLTSSQFRLRVLVIIFIAATLSIGLTVSLGYTGQFNLSQGTFYGLGAYTTAILVADHGVPFELALLAAVAVAALGGVVFGISSLRVRGDYFALLSLAFTIAMVQVIENAGVLTRGREGFAGIPLVSLFGMRLDNVTAFYYSTLGLMLLSWLLVSRVTRSFAGRAMLAVRFDEVAARAMGISVSYTKLLALAVSSGIAGAAGAFLVATVGFIAPSNFDLLPSISSTIYVIIGGMTSIAGSALAAALVTFVTEEFRQLADIRIALLGVVVFLAVMYRGGVIGDLLRRRGGR